MPIRSCGVLTCVVVEHVVCNGVHPTRLWLTCLATPLAFNFRYPVNRLVGLHRGASDRELEIELNRCTNGMNCGWIYALPVKTIWPLQTGQSLVNLAKAFIWAGHGRRDALKSSAVDVIKFVNDRLSVSRRDRVLLGV